MGISIWQILIIVLLVVLLFGRGKISDLMGDFAKGIRSFKKGLNEDEEDERPAPKAIASERQERTGESTGERDGTKA
ncbi:MAG TPA: twin-arginine translocase TatA/TatE family subunit, partial [Sphingomonadales bacterium]